MSITAILMLGFFAITAVIVLAITICTVHGNESSKTNEKLNLEFKLKALEMQRNSDQQQAAVNEAYQKGKSEGLQYTSTEVRKALEALPKAPSVIVQR